MGLMARGTMYALCQHQWREVVVIQHVRMMKNMHCGIWITTEALVIYKTFDPLTTDDGRFPSVHLRYTDGSILHLNEFSAVI